MYCFFRNLLKPFIMFLYQVKIEGKEHIPTDSSAILAPNHRSNWDPLWVAFITNREIVFLAKEELFHNKIIGFLLKKCHVIPVKRNTGDMAAIRTCIRSLKKGELLGIFPEGTRVKNGKESEPKEGVALLASKAGAPIIPISISADYRMFGKNKVVIHPPVVLQDTWTYEESMERVMKIVNEGVTLG